MIAKLSIFIALFYTQIAFPLNIDELKPHIGDSQITLLGESHLNIETIKFEVEVIKYATKEKNIKILALEIPQKLGKQLLENYVKGVIPKEPREKVVYMWLDAFGYKENLNEKKIIFFDLPKENQDSAACANGTSICDKYIKLQSDYFKSRDKYMSESILKEIKKEKVLVITGAQHIWKKEVEFGIPFIASQFETGKTNITIDWEGKKVTFTSLKLDDVKWVHFSLAKNLGDQLGQNNIKSILLLDKSSPMFAANKYLALSNLILGSEPESKNITFDYTSENSMYKLFNPFQSAKQYLDIVIVVGN